jgi:hypothetical protein
MDEEHWLVPRIVASLGTALAPGERGEIERAALVVVAKLLPRDRAILRMVISHGLGSEGVAKLLGGGRDDAARFVRELERRVVADVRAAVDKAPIDETATDP